MTLTWVAGQLAGLVALGFCLAGFASKQDDRLLVLLISANIAFALQFIFFQSWTAAVLTLLVIIRILLARRYPGNLALMSGLLLANFLAAALTWQHWIDILPLTAATLGTFGMFMLRGIPLRILLGMAAFCWLLNNLLIGSFGGSLAEGLIVVTNIFTIWRLAKLQKEKQLSSREA
ncbi:inner membrane protein [Marinospirillum celere]|uniref:Inner membrane protein n=1 Tax=Marinospirillum celere TaxID=1122252 RepID=A0A1I1GL79_9GAMM|nr:YgjV family protein [Marinospirillum celere]SFC12547.1 inner membrane protein [Marinospirillum celere]